MDFKGRCTAGRTPSGPRRKSSLISTPAGGTRGITTSRTTRNIELADVRTPVAWLAWLLAGLFVICGGGPALANKTLDDFFPVVVEHRGASYLDARDAILAAAAKDPEIH